MEKCCVCGRTASSGGTALADGYICGRCLEGSGLNTLTFVPERPLSSENAETVAGFVRRQRELRKRFRSAQECGELALDPEKAVFRVKGVLFDYADLDRYEAEGDVRIGLAGELTKKGRGGSGAAVGGAIGSIVGPVGTAVGAAIGAAIGKQIPRACTQMDLVLYLKDPLVVDIRLTFIREKIRTNTEEFKEQFALAADTVKGLEMIRRHNHPEEFEDEEEEEEKTEQEERAEEPAEKPAAEAPAAEEEELEPCRGDGPFVFISYAHRDSDRVYPILRKLVAMGLRVWFDEAIVPSTYWDDDLAKHIENCDGMISFISANYIDSQNCRDELKYARAHNRPQLLIYLEQTELPSGIAMRLSTIQAIKMDLSDPKTTRKFYEKIRECPFVARNLPDR